jgi:hypothetical protein
MTPLEIAEKALASNELPDMEFGAMILSVHAAENITDAHKAYILDLLVDELHTEQMCREFL